MYKKLFIPGPTHVREKILQAQAAPMLGHRSKEYADLQAEVTPKLQQMLYTQQRVYLYSCSSTGVMEGSVRQASTKKVLNTVCGAFSKRWHQITAANGVACDKVEVPMGQAITPELVDEALSQGDYDAITVVMNETSTGLMNPIEGIAASLSALTFILPYQQLDQAAEAVSRVAQLPANHAPFRPQFRVKQV